MAQIWCFQTDGSDLHLFKPTIQIFFVIRGSEFSISNFNCLQLILSEAMDMMMCGLHRSMDEIISGLQNSENSNLKPYFPARKSSEAMDQMTRGLADRWFGFILGFWHFGCFGTLEIRQLQHFDLCSLRASGLHTFWMNDSYNLSESRNPK
jgi:hypothetical protein